MFCILLYLAVTLFHPQGLIISNNIILSMSVQIKYIEKVEELAKIKKKQDEDKAAVRLHSFKLVV